MVSALRTGGPPSAHRIAPPRYHQRLPSSAMASKDHDGCSLLLEYAQAQPRYSSTGRASWGPARQAAAL